jgi:hypothetical protein
MPRTGVNLPGEAHVTKETPHSDRHTPSVLPSWRRPSIKNTVGVSLEKTSTYAIITSAAQAGAVRLAFHVHGNLLSRDTQNTKHAAFTMRATTQLLSTLLLLAAGAAQAASSWSFDDGSISVVSKKDGDGAAQK